MGTVSNLGAEKAGAELEKFQKDQDDAAAKRFDELSAERKNDEEKYREGGPKEVEDENRIESRKAMLTDSRDSLSNERMLGTNDLMQINYLSKGLSAGRSVCRINICNKNGIAVGYGSGFLVAPYLLLTNHHVLPNADYALYSRAEFDYEVDDEQQSKVSRMFQFNPREFFYSNKELDFALVAVDRRNTAISLGGTTSDSTENSISPLKLIERSGKAVYGEYVSIIQHPSGLDKRISVRNNRVVGIKDQYIHYETDTEAGSSGSPVFNDQWEVVALHHAGVTRCDITSGPHKECKTVANEGIRISAIFQHLKAKTDWDRAQARRLEELGTFSSSDLNVAVSNTSDSRHILRGESASKLPTMPNVPPIKLSKLIDQLASVDEDEHQEKLEMRFAPYFVESNQHSHSIDPTFRINTDLVMIDNPKLEATIDQLNPANSLCKMSRHAAYEIKKNEHKGGEDAPLVKILAYGDSWFQYPFALNDVVDHLMAKPDLAVLTLGTAGQPLRVVVGQSEFVSALHREKPGFFLLSAGCNDLVAYGGIKRFVKPVEGSFSATQLIDFDELSKIRAQISANLTNLFTIILHTHKPVNILFHGYSSPIPSNGRWLGQPLNELGITDSRIQAEIVRIIFDELNDELHSTAESFPNSVHFMDIRDVVPARGWYDELHPTNPFYGDVAAAFEDLIRDLQAETSALLQIGNDEHRWVDTDQSIDNRIILPNRERAAAIERLTRKGLVEFTFSPSNFLEIFKSLELQAVADPNTDERNKELGQVYAREKAIPSGRLAKLKSYKYQLTNKGKQRCKEVIESANTNAK